MKVKKMRSSLLIFTITILCFGFVFSQSNKNVSNVGTVAAPFLQIGVGSRAIGMGGAFVATANDISAMYWNPAGLSRLNKIETIFVHSEWLADITFDYAGIVFPMAQYGIIGVNITMLNMGEMEVRTVDRPEGTGELFEVSDLALALAYGINLTNRFSIGFNLKYIRQKIWKESASGFAVDIGTLYHTPVQGLRIGAVLTNFGTDMKMTGNDLLVYYDVDPYQSGNNDQIFAQIQTDSWPLPLNFQLGVAMDVVQDESHQLTIEADAVHPNDNTESMHLGLEYGFNKQFFLRAGYRNLFQKDSEEGITIGGGMSLNLFGDFQASLNYAYADFGRLENAQRFSIRLRF
jgi:long-subunit fatty acid transport protein